MKKSLLKSDGRNGERCMYFVCDFNGRWLKDSSLLYSIAIISSVGGRVGYVMYVRCFLKLISLQFSKIKSNELTTR
jgi:hypothetical protein